MKKLIFTFLIFPTLLFSQNFDNGYNFNMPAFDGSQQKYLPEFEAKPINGFVSTNSDGNFVYRGKPIRFWGVNNTSGACFPEKDLAAGIATRMRKMGFNIVRFHHMDNPWSGQEATLFDRSTNNTRTLYEPNVDKLHNFLFHLKENGIFANINLRVSRSFRTGDGIADASDFWGGGKVIDMFDPQLINLQKEYATQLLTAVNPYTGLSMAEDPVVAMVEISNENTLYGRWKNSQLTTQDDDGILLERHDDMLNDIWIDFLRDKYGTQNALASAWNVGAGGNTQVNQVGDGDFESGDIETNWDLELHNSANGIISTETDNPYEGDYCGKIEITNATGVDWHTQFRQITLSVEAGKSYRVKFAARADAEKEMSVYVMQNFDPWNWYDGESFDLNTDWEEYEFIVTPFEDNDGRVRLGFSFDGEAGTFWLDNVSFSEIGKTAFESGESLNSNNVRRLRYYELNGFTEGRTADMTEFYIKVQKDYFDEMNRFLKENLGIKVPITGTNAHPGVADVYTNSDLDYIDDHAYWDHPRYPNGWDLNDWQIRNQPLVSEWDLESISKVMGGYAIDGKPFTISEYQHAFPNRFQTEMMPLISSYGSFHDVDGIMFFQYAESNWDWETDYMDAWWSMHRNPAQMALSPIYSFAYRKNLIQSDDNRINFNYSKEYMHQISRFDGTSRWWSFSPFERRLALQTDIRIGSFDADEINLGDLPEVNDEAEINTSNFETTFNADNQYVTTVTPQLISVTGQLSNPIVIQAGDLEVTGANEFGTVGWLSLTEEPLNTSRRSVLVLSSKAQNSNMSWSNNYNVNNEFGEAPTEMYPLSTSLLMRINADSIQVFPLSPKGEPLAPLSFMPISPGLFLVGIDQAVHQTPWYGIETYGDMVSSTTQSEEELKITLSPNPTADNVLISGTANHKVQIELSDASGKIFLSENAMPVNQQIQHWVNVSNFPKGIYFLKIQNGKKFKTEKLVIH